MGDGASLKPWESETGHTGYSRSQILLPLLGRVPRGHEQDSKLEVALCPVLWEFSVLESRAPC